MTREPRHTIPPFATKAPPRARPFGNFHVLSKLAEGAMGIVWVAAPWDRLEEESLVVLKTTKGATTPELRDLFLDEARLAMRLHHRNIVRTFEAGFVDGEGYFAMEYLRGQTLHRLRNKLRPKGLLPLEAEVRILADTIAALHHAHTLRSEDGRPLGIVHRDVAAQNIFVPYAGETKLLDFGVARASATAEAGPIALAGRVRYMAPEQARRAQSDPRGDVFAMGILLAEALTGARFWGDADDETILEALREGRVPDPFDDRHDAPLVALVRPALAADPEARPQTIHALRTDLETWLHRQPGRGDLAPLKEVMGTFFAQERGQAQRTLQALLAELRQEAAGAGPSPSEQRLVAAQIAPGVAAPSIAAPAHTASPEGASPEALAPPPDGAADRAPSAPTPRGTPRVNPPPPPRGRPLPLLPFVAVVLALLAAGYALLLRR